MSIYKGYLSLSTAFIQLFIFFLVSWEDCTERILFNIEFNNGTYLSRDLAFLMFNVRIDGVTVMLQWLSEDEAVK